MKYFPKTLLGHEIFRSMKNTKNAFVNPSRKGVKKEKKNGYWKAL